MDLTGLTDQTLVSTTLELVGSHREITANLVVHLGEIEVRRLHLLAGFSSMFDFCQKKLGLGEGEAFRRILAARLGRRFPVVYALLAEGRVQLSTLELAREWLTEENHQELLSALAGKSKYEVKAVLAARFPQPDRPSRIRRASVEPLSESRFEITFTAGEELRRKLELCRDLMSHANPARELGVIVERAVDLLLRDLERTRLGRTKRRSQATGSGKKTVLGTPSRRENEPPRVAPSRVTASVRRQVFERDGMRCTFVAEDGRRCESRAFLQLDHIEPRALGGLNDASNLRVRCGAHNQLWAEQAFGREAVERGRRLRQQKLQERLRPRAENPSNTRPVLDKVRLALESMGFRAGEARRAVEEIANQHAPHEVVPLEQALREAVLRATAA